MELRTYTSLWNVERRLYKIYDWTIPFPNGIGFLQIAAIFCVGLPWFGLMHLLGVPFHTPGDVAWLAPPAAAAWWAGKPIAEGKTIVGLANSQLRYLLQPRTLTRLAPAGPLGPARVHAVVYRRTP